MTNLEELDPEVVAQQLVEFVDVDAVALAAADLFVDGELSALHDQMDAGTVTEEPEDDRPR